MATEIPHSRDVDARLDKNRRISLPKDMVLDVFPNAEIPEMRPHVVSRGHREQPPAAGHKDEWQVVLAERIILFYPFQAPIGEVDLLAIFGFGVRDNRLFILPVDVA